MKNAILTKYRAVRVWFVVCLAGAAAVAAVTGFFASSALGVGGPPLWQQPPIAQIVHSTRAVIELGLETEEIATAWHVEYAPAEADGKAPPVGSSAWKITNSGLTSTGNGTESIYLVNADEPLRHLQPNTLYYARFVAKNAGSSTPEGTVDQIEFKTLPVGAPEVAKPVLEEVLREEGGSTFAEQPEEATDTTAAFSAQVETNGAQTEYFFEYATSPNGPWQLFTSGAAGTITVAQDYAKVEAHLSKLKPETRYYVRLKAVNQVGKFTQEKYQASVELGEVGFFTTGTAKPSAGEVAVRNVTADSAHVSAHVNSHGSQTAWRLESSDSSGGPWTQVAEGTITQEQAEAVSYRNSVILGASFVHLSASTGYYVRMVTKNGNGESIGEVSHFETSGAPSATTFAVHALHEDSWRLLGAVNPDSLPTSLEQTIEVEGASGGTFTLIFEGATTETIKYEPTGKGSTVEAIRQALEKLPSSPEINVEGLNSGPFTVLFRGRDEKVSVSPVESGPSNLTPSGANVKLTTLQLGGEAYVSHYHFQYEPASVGCDEDGYKETPEVEVGSGDTSQVVGADVPGLKSGEHYCYRLVASNNAPGTSVVDGAVDSLVVPAVPVAGGVGGCPNAAFRTGLSARLPDCRAYEQVTPVDKEGAQEPFHYRAEITSALLVDESGERVALEAPVVSLGAGPGAGQSPYFFSREEGKAWDMLAGAAQPETGISKFKPQAYSADLSMVAFQSEYQTSVYGESPTVDYELGHAGGPYTLVASVPRKDVLSGSEGWVAANGDFSKLVLQSADHELLEESTGTKSGTDLYEYTPGGGLRQLNVDEQGTIGSCGAVVARGEEKGAQTHLYSGPHTISVDGSKVFFEAVPGHECGATKNLYMRVDGSETVDIGAYKFMGADAQGTNLLLKNNSGELFGYDTESKTIVSQSSNESASANELRLLGIPVQHEPTPGDSFSSPRYTYFTGEVAGLRGNGIIPPNPIFEEGEGEGSPATQVYRYDDVQGVVQCVSCASSFDPEPKRPAYLDGIQGLSFVNGGLPVYTATSANGDFAFFSTIAALVPEDVDGEIPAINSVTSHSEYVNVGGHTSPSTDVYEWRGDGVDGCGVLGGCVSLITDGRGGYLNLLLGSADEGRDVFIYTRSQLVPQDKDTSGDIYDVRVDGGLPEAPPPGVECEGDACSSPPPVPNDQTPASFTFQGGGNLLAAPLVQPAPTKPKSKPKLKSKKKKVAKRKPKARKSSKRKSQRAEKSARRIK